MAANENVYMAKLAEQAERFEEMVEYMSVVAKTQPKLELEERNLLSAAYKNVVGSRWGTAKTRFGANTRRARLSSLL